MGFSDSQPTRLDQVISSDKMSKSADKTQKVAKAAPEHPKYAEMIATAITTFKDRTGTSRQAIKKYIMENYKVGDDEKRVGVYVKLALKKGVEAGVLKMARSSGKGAGSYKIGEKAKSEEKAKKPKKVAKPATAKKTAATKNKRLSVVQKSKKSASASASAKPKKTAKKPTKTDDKKKAKKSTDKKVPLKKATKAKKATPK